MINRLGLTVVAFVAACAMLLIIAFKTDAAAEHYGLQIGSEHFLLEVAADNRSRYIGLSGRESIAAQGGMIFVFPTSGIRNFYMRDCVVPIDIVFLNSSGVIVAMHTMEPEEPRALFESAKTYEKRLMRYSSRGHAQYAIELRAGTIDRLGLKQADRLALDTRRLQNAIR